MYLDINVRVKTVKLLEENTEGNLHNLGLGKEFLTLTSLDTTNW